MSFSFQWNCVKTEAGNNQTWRFWQTTSLKRKKQTPWERNGEWQLWSSIVFLLGFISSLSLLHCLLLCLSHRDLEKANCEIYINFSVRLNLSVRALIDGYNFIDDFGTEQNFPKMISIKKRACWKFLDLKWLEKSMKFWLRASLLNNNERAEREQNARINTDRTMTMIQQLCFGRGIRECREGTRSQSQ